MYQLQGSADPRPHFLALPAGDTPSILCLHSSVPILGPCCTVFTKVKGTGKSSASLVEALPSLGPKHHSPEILLWKEHSCRLSPELGLKKIALVFSLFSFFGQE